MGFENNVFDLSKKFMINITLIKDMGLRFFLTQVTYSHTSNVIVYVLIT